MPTKNKKGISGSGALQFCSCRGFIRLRNWTKKKKGMLLERLGTTVWEIESSPAKRPSIARHCARSRSAWKVHFFEFASSAHSRHCVALRNALTYFPVSKWQRPISWCTQARGTGWSTWIDSFSKARAAASKCPKLRCTLPRVTRACDRTTTSLVFFDSRTIMATLLHARSCRPKAVWIRDKYRYACILCRQKSSKPEDNVSKSSASLREVFILPALKLTFKFFSIALARLLICFNIVLDRISLEVNGPSVEEILWEVFLRLSRYLKRDIKILWLKHRDTQYYSSFKPSKTKAFR